MENKMDITPDKLMSDGWVKTDDPLFIYEKAIPNRNPINNTPEDSDIKLVIHGLLNQWRFAVLLPSGALLNFVANSLDELKAFEKCIDFYDPEY